MARSVLIGLVLLLLLGAEAEARQHADLGAMPGAPGIKKPIRFAKTPDGNILVSDFKTHRVSELRPGSLRVVRAFAVNGAPLAVECSGDLVLVGISTPGVVEVYTRAGERLRRLGGPEHRFGQVNDIAVDDGEGLVVVVDSTAKLVKIFPSHGARQLSPFWTIPAGAPDPNVLADPSAVAIDVTRKEILVADFGATESSIPPRVRIFDYQGALLQTISGRAGMMGYRFYRPQGLTVSADGRIFLADSYTGQVLVLDRDTGSTLATFGTYGTDPGQLMLPLDVVIAGDSEDLVVANNGAGRIEVFPGGGANP
jgi:DNA-binding beta-propeller fold protein YncE